MRQDVESPLWNAVHAGKAYKIPGLLASLQTSSREKTIDDLLWFATEKGHASIVRMLLAAGGKLEQTRAGLTLLLTAAWNGNSKVVKALVEAGARFDRRVKGTTPLEAALENHHLEIANYLQDLGAKWTRTTLLHACQQGDLMRVKQALAAGARIGSRSGPWEETPLMAAAGHGQIQILRYLLKKIKRPSPVEINDALWLAAASHNTQAIDLLVAAGANFNHANHTGCTVLMIAAQSGDISTLKHLMDLGADIHAIDHASQSVLDYARKSPGRQASAWLQKLRAHSARDLARDCARKIARVFGGRPAPGSFGYELKSSLSGLKCLFRIAHAGGSVVIEDLHFTQPDLRRADNAELILGQDPDKKRGDFRVVKGAEQMLKVPVYRSVDPRSIPAARALQFLAAHRAALQRILASADIEEIWIGASFVRLTWTGSDLPALELSLRAFGTLVQAVAGQSRPRRTFLDDFSG